MVLLAASAVSALTGEITGSVIIWAIVLMSVTLDSAQEYRAGRNAEQLKKKLSQCGPRYCATGIPKSSRQRTGAG